MCWSKDKINVLTIQCFPYRAEKKIKVLFDILTLISDDIQLTSVTKTVRRGDGGESESFGGGFNTENIQPT